MQISTLPPALSRGDTTPCAPTRAELFVDGEHTAGDDTTFRIALQLLEEIGVINDAARFLSAETNSPKPNKRTLQNLDKQVCFIVSFLRAATKVDWFGILMDRHRWTGKPCGYQAAATITKALIQCGLLLRAVAPKKRRCATIYRCSDSFRDRLVAWRDSLTYKRVVSDLIVVRAAKADYRGCPGERQLPLSDFPEDAIQFQQALVRRINEHLSSHVLKDADGRKCDTTLRRIYTGSLVGGGRTYGDYQNMSESQRLRCTIDGEPVCEIDLKASHVSILAALTGYAERLPPDPYAAIDWVKTKQHRKAAKILVQCIIHAIGSSPKRFPRQDGKPFKEKYGLKDQKIEDLLPGIYAVMPFLRSTPRLTLELQFIEAEMLMDVLQRLCDMGIPAFPIHDSVLIRKSDEEVVVRVLQEKLRDALGHQCPWLDVSAETEPPRPIAPLDGPATKQPENHLKSLIKYETLLGYEE